MSQTVEHVPFILAIVVLLILVALMVVSIVLCCIQVCRSGSLMHAQFGGGQQSVVPALCRPCLEVKVDDNAAQSPYILESCGDIYYLHKLDHERLAGRQRRYGSMGDIDFSRGEQVRLGNEISYL
ncbi:uncharacterized protein LOC128217354 [Mya arenaria]|uniref:uncharacterized protein LOC128217354 n=1 Tax=Mya arenaria TaxID=6604 RepID=UPI0022DFACC1|nr:uncharacterized protein LOC128217354 [Mya arenaria]